MTTCLLLFCATFSLPVKAGTTAYACTRYLEYIAPSADSKTLADRIYDANSELDRLIKKSDYILAVNRQLVVQSGNNHIGIFEVQTPDGIKLMKVLPPNLELERSRHQFVMQNFLSERGLAPKVWAIIRREEVRKIPLRSYKAHSYAVVMDMIPQPWNVTRDQIAPAAILSWNPHSIIEQIKTIEKTTKRFGIIPYDAQVVISVDGHVELIDISDYSWISPSGIEYGTKWPGQPPKSFKARARNLLTGSLYSVADPTIAAYLEALNRAKHSAKP